MSQLPHALRPFPHEGGCESCRALRQCNVCSVPLTGGLTACTNGRCPRCHRTVCTPGGATADGHGYGNPTPSEGT